MNAGNDGANSQNQDGQKKIYGATKKESITSAAYLIGKQNKAAIWIRKPPEV